MEGHVAIDYFIEAQKYRPSIVRTLLVAEAPPKGGHTYFYVPKSMNPGIPIARQSSLSATIFYHYFREIPATEKRYAELLNRLKRRRIFLIDICDEPIGVRNSPEGLQRITREIPKLRAKLRRLKIRIGEDRIIFLHARKNYSRKLRSAFPTSRHTCWMCFRMNWESADR
jgi:hypothetical protein